MFNQGLGLVLDKQIDRMDFGIDQIAQYEIHDPVPAAERNRWFRTLGREWKEAGAHAAGHYHGQDFGVTILGLCCFS